MQILQIFDISHKLLYDDIKAEYDFHSMINATVSHELRNPLNSMILQLECMNHNLKQLIKIQKVIKNTHAMNSTFKKDFEQLESHINQLKDSGRRINNSSKLIDFFVHDILDYAVLNGKNQNFTKRIQIFDVRDSVDQIIELMKDKAQMKNITIKTEFFGFKAHLVELRSGTCHKYLVKSDEKRLQQVFLNLLSNSLKFTQ